MRKDLHQNDGGLLLYEFLNPAYFTISQHHLDTVRMRWAVGEDARHQSFGKLACGLVLFQNNPNM